MYTIYQTTCHVNNKIYIGLHKCNQRCIGKRKKNCTYYGSGTMLSNAIKKHGKHNFSKIVLFEFDKKEEALEMERKIVTEEFVARNDTYNRTIGGNMPPDQSGYKYSEEQLSKRNENFPEDRKVRFGLLAKQTIENRKLKTGKAWSDEHVAKRVATRKEKNSYNNSMKEANSKESIEKRVATRKQRNGYSKDLSHLSKKEVVFERTKSRILKQLKEGKHFYEETLSKYDIDFVDNR